MPRTTRKPAEPPAPVPTPRRPARSEHDWWDEAYREHCNTLGGMLAMRTAAWVQEITDWLYAAHRSPEWAAKVTEVVIGNYDGTPLRGAIRCAEKDIAEAEAKR